MSTTTKHKLISAEYIQQATSIDFNVDVGILNDSIIDSQSEYIENIVGTGLFREILIQHQSGIISGNNETLLNDYIAPALAFYSLYEASDFLLFKFKNKTIGKEKAEDIEPINLKELNHLKTKLKNKAERRGQRIVDFLCANIELYPLYTNPGNSADTIRPSSNAYSSSIFLYKTGRHSSQMSSKDASDNEITLN